MDYAQARQEPSLDEILSDPIVRMLMAMDGVEEADIMPLLHGLTDDDYAL